MDELEKMFEKRVDLAIKEMKNFNYVPKIFISMRNEYGTIEAIKKLLREKKIPRGFTTLWENNHLDLSMENIILEKEWHSLFTDEDRRLAQKRLKDYGFKVQSPE